MVNPGAHYRCPEVCGRLFAVWEPNDAYNTVDTNVGTYNTVCVRAVEEYCSRRHTGYGPSIMFDFVHCLLHLPLVPFEQVSPVGWPQSALAAPVEEEW